jgi:hypothetical protein
MGGAFNAVSRSWFSLPLPSSTHCTTKVPNHSLIMGTQEKKQEGVIPTHTPLQPQSVDRVDPLLITPFRFLNAALLVGIGYAKAMLAVANGGELELDSREIGLVVLWAIMYVPYVAGLRHLLARPQSRIRYPQVLPGPFGRAGSIAKPRRGF